MNNIYMKNIRRSLFILKVQWSIDEKLNKIKNKAVEFISSDTKQLVGYKEKQKRANKVKTNSVVLSF